MLVTRYRRISQSLHDLVARHIPDSFKDVLVDAKDLNSEPIVTHDTDLLPDQIKRYDDVGPEEQKEN